MGTGQRDLRVTRRDILRALAGGVALAGAGSLLPTALARPGSAPARAVELEMKRFRRWCEYLDGLGLRHPGSEQQAAYVEFLAERLHAAGVSDVHLEPVRLQRYAPHQVSLDVAGEPVRLASYVPYSGFTPPGGIEGTIGYLTSPSSWPNFAFQGEIALIDVPPAPQPLVAGKPGTYYVHDPDRTLATEVYDRPVFLSIQVTNLLYYARGVGADAAVCVLPYSWDLAQGSYIEVGFFDAAGHNPGVIPAVYVDRDTGQRLKELAAGAGAPARLVLEGTSDVVTSHNVVGEIPGASRESIILNTHTDGQNAVEENGTFGILHVCEQLLAAGCLPKTVTVVLTSGHFAGYAGARQFIAAHADDVIARALCNVTIEHLGTLEWEPGSDGRYALNGLVELGAMYVPPNRRLASECVRYLQRDDLRRHAVLKNSYPEPNSNSTHLVGVGESVPFQGAGIPSIQLGSAPTYLLNYGIPTADKLDYDLMYRQAHGFVSTVWNLLHASREELRTRDLVVGYPGSGAAADDLTIDLPPATDVPIACA